MKRILFYILLIMLFAVSANARDISSLPHTEDFEDASGDTSEYADALSIDTDSSPSARDAEAVHLEGGGWDGGDAVRFLIAANPDSSQGLGINVSGASTSVIHVRYIIRIPSSMLNHLDSVQEPKLNIFNKVGGGANERLIAWWSQCNESPKEYPLMVSGKGNANVSPADCDGSAEIGVQMSNTGSPTIFDYVCNRYGNNGMAAFGWEDHVGEWVSIEMSADLRSTADDDSMIVWVTTQDGTFDETIVLRPPCGMYDKDDSVFALLEIGMYGGGTPLSYYDMDEVVVNDTYIGPPAGFIGGATATTLQGMNASGVELQ